MTQKKMVQPGKPSIKHQEERKELKDGRVLPSKYRSIKWVVRGRSITITANVIITITVVVYLANGSNNTSSCSIGFETYVQ
jgi:hypothetical protein